MRVHQVGVFITKALPHHIDTLLLHFHLLEWRAVPSSNTSIYALQFYHAIQYLSRLFRLLLSNLKPPAAQRLHHLGRDS